MIDAAGRKDALVRGLDLEARVIHTVARASTRKVKNLSTSADLAPLRPDEETPAADRDQEQDQNTEVDLAVIPPSPDHGGQEVVLTADQGHEGQVDLAQKLVIAVPAALPDHEEDRVAGPVPEERAAEP